jgi:hypothetical protein
VFGPRAAEYGPVTVIIEAKGNWYRLLYREMGAQLAGRYLRYNRCRHSLYLVGWFNWPQWDTDDPRNRTAMRRDLADTLDRLRGRPRNSRRANCRWSRSSSMLRCAECSIPVKRLPLQTSVGGFYDDCLIPPDCYRYPVLSDKKSRTSHSWPSTNAGVVARHSLDARLSSNRRWVL